ncbi:recombinase family protein [Fictibacillus phosphorivorans]|uniref:recombinase family protein n=1 Tax=Fictibacillus phosphorivorans TaxID=1221500 RepID=UPI003CE9780E
MKKTVIYTRQSLDAEKQKNSTDVQKDKCLEHARKNGLIVHDYFNEGERSARITGIEGRPQLLRLLHEAEKGDIERVIVYKRDRLARNVEQYMTILSRFIQANVQILFAADNEPPILSGPIGEFVEIILAGLAQQEGENIFLRQTEAKIYNAKNGLRSAGGAPYGYVLEDKLMKPTESGKKVIKRIYELFDAYYHESRSFDEILWLMNEQFDEEKLAVHLEKEFVISIIRRPIHKGILVQHVAGKRYEAKVEKADVVSGVLWESVNTKLEKLSPHLFEEKDEKPSYIPMLKDKVICRACTDTSSETSDLVFLKSKTVNYTCISTSCKTQVKMAILDELVVKKVLLHIKEIAGKQHVKLKTILEQHFLERPRRKIETVKGELSILESRIKKALEKMVLEKQDEHDLDMLTQTYKDKVQELLSIENKMYELEQAIKGDEVEQYVDHLTIQNLNREQKERLLAQVQLVYVGKESFRISLADRVS